MQRKLFGVFFVLFFLISCQKDDQSVILPQTLLNQAYGTNTQQVMDIYLPAGRNALHTKVIILIHGGGWNSGDKSDFTVYVDTLKKRLPGYAIFNINYRLAAAPDLFPAQENDVKSAVEFIYNKRMEYGISDMFVLLGASAGAHLALLQGYKYSTPVRAKAIIDLFGPTDLAEMYNNPPNPLVPLLLSTVTGFTPPTNPVLYQESSPVNYISSQSPSTIIFHGGADFVVSSSQSVNLRNILQSNAVINEYHFYPTESHGWTGANLTDTFNKITAFLSTYVN